MGVEAVKAVIKTVLVVLYRRRPTFTYSLDELSPSETR
jgi:hypothetical protein